MNLIPQPDVMDISMHESMPAKAWERIINIDERHIRRVCGSGLIPRYKLKPEWRQTVNELLVKQSLSSCHDLHRALTTGSADAWQPRKKLGELRPESQTRASKIRDVMVAHYAMITSGTPLERAREVSAHLWNQTFGKGGSTRSIKRWEKRVELAGGIDRAPIEAFADGRNGSRKDRAGFPPDFSAWFSSRFLDSTKDVPGLGAIMLVVTELWRSGQEVPGLGVREGSEPFPYTRDQLKRLMPGRAAREKIGKGDFLAKAHGYMATMPMSWANIEPLQFVMYDDKLINVEVMTNDGRRVFRPHIYIAYCAGSGRVLSYIVREENRITQLDVEALVASVLRQHGIGGTEVGWCATHIFERGTVSMSPERKAFLEALFPGRLKISTTGMIGGDQGIDFQQKASGNFFGKARIEAFMGAIDKWAKVMPGQTGHRYDVAPATLGDTTLDLETLARSARLGYKGNRSIIEVGLLNAAMAKALVWLESGENVSAYEASKRTGIKPPTLFFDDFVTCLGELFAAFNNRRGHRMNGFAKLRVPHPDGQGVMEVAESPNDKAKRQLLLMQTEGRELHRPHDADVMMLLHKVKRVRVTPRGVTTEGVRYWSPDSEACRAAADVQGGEKFYLALYNPFDPVALYLLTNPTSHVSAKATELPAGIQPQLFEVLPAWDAPTPGDREAEAKRYEQIARFNHRIGREVVVTMEPIIREQQQREQDIHDRTEPLRTALRSAESPVAPKLIPRSQLADHIAQAEGVVTEAKRSRKSDQPSAAEKLAEFLAEE